jgi:hypothetical protein
MRASEPITRRQYLTIKALVGGTTWFTAIEAVSSTALEHPEWDMDETKTYDEWEKHV